MPARPVPRRTGLPGRLLHALLLLAAMGLAACSPAPRDLAPPSQAQIAALRDAFLALGPEVDAREATRAARIAYRYPLQLARAYQITDAPLVHNTKVNLGLKPRGLCWHWAHDMQDRMAQEGFTTLALHRAIAAPLFRIDHSTLVMSAKGDPMEAGLVIDPWRNGGRLFWSPVGEDARYRWEPRAVVQDRARARRAAGAGG